MTVAAGSVPYVRYTYDGPHDTKYSFNFKVQDDDNLYLTYQNLAGTIIPLTIDVDYTVVLNPGSIGGICRLTYAATEGYLNIVRRTVVEQASDWVNNDYFNVELLESDLDHVVMILQEMYAEIELGSVDGQWRADWQPNTHYSLRDNVVAPNTNIYTAFIDHVSSSNLGTDLENFEQDLAAGNWSLVIDVKTVTEATELAIAAAASAVNSATESKESENNAKISETQSGFSEANSSVHAQDAANCAHAAVDFAMAAEHWAEMAEDNPVPEGNGSEFSAHHWAIKASDVVASGGIDALIAVPPLIQDATDPNIPIVRIDPARVAQWDGQSTLRENDIINGSFRIWQRRHMANITGLYSADRWKIDFGDSSGNGIMEFTRRDSLTTIGGSEDNNLDYYARVENSSSNESSSYATFSTRIRDLKKYLGKRICLTFWAQSDEGNELAVNAERVFGDGGSFSDRIAGQKVTLSTTFTKHTIFMDIPEQGAQAMGFRNHLHLIFWTDAGQHFNWDTDSIGNQSGTTRIADVSMCISDVVVPFRLKSYDDELLACLPYFQKSYDVDTPIGSTTVNGATTTRLDSPTSQADIFVNAGLSPRMCKKPTVNLYTDHGVLGHANAIYTSAYTFAAKPVGESETRAFSHINRMDGVVVTNTAVWFHWTAEAELETP